MHKVFHNKKRFLTLSLAICLCIAGCGNTASVPIVENTSETSVVSTEEAVTMESSIEEDTSLIAETAETVMEEASREETTTDLHTPATLIAYATDIEETVWYEGDLDIRIPEASALSSSWNNTLPIPLWGETDIIASIEAPLSLENIQTAGYQFITENGSNAAFLSDGSAKSYIIGYMPQSGNQPEYIVASLDITTLLNSDAPTLQHVLSVLGIPDFGFAYHSLETRYYYLFDSYYIEVSMSKADTTKTTWSVSEILYFDSSAFLNFDLEQELNSIKKSGLHGFTSSYWVPSGF